MHIAGHGPNTSHRKTPGSVRGGLHQASTNVHDAIVSTAVDANVFSGLEAPSFRWNVSPDKQASKWLNPAGDIPDEEISDFEDALTHMDLLDNFLRKVRVKLLSLEWGGEYIGNPCPHVFGYVQDMVVEGIGGQVYFLVDFGAYLGMQMVPVTDCDPWAAKEVSAEETAAIDFVIAFAKPEQFQASDAFGVSLAPEQGQFLHQRDEDEHTMNDWMAANTSMGTNASELRSQGATVTAAGSESDPEWLPVHDYIADGGDNLGACHWGVSSGDSDPDALDTTNVLLAQLGFYTEGPRTQAEEEFAKRYSEANWHAKTWNLLPRTAFCGPPPGPKHDYGQNVPTSTECFLMLWDDKV